jgi:hypothetical protein
MRWRLRSKTCRHWRAQVYVCPDVSGPGKRFKVGPRERAPWLTIVGVVGDVCQIGLDSPAPFRRMSRWHRIRTRDSSWLPAAGDTASVLAAVQRTLRKLDPGLLIDNTQTMSQRDSYRSRPIAPHK